MTEHIFMLRPNDLSYQVAQFPRVKCRGEKIKPKASKVRNRRKQREDRLMLLEGASNNKVSTISFGTGHIYVSPNSKDYERIYSRR